jgi:hypothetical protein
VGKENVEGGGRVKEEDKSQSKESEKVMRTRR